jgi:E3 ubiquitin-protein ligase DOA10
MMAGSCGAFIYVRDKVQYQRTMMTEKAQLEVFKNRYSEEVGGNVTDYCNWSYNFEHRFHALKLFFVLRYLGREGIVAHLKHKIALAEHFLELLEDQQRRLKQHSKQLPNNLQQQRQKPAAAAEEEGERQQNAAETLAKSSILEDFEEEYLHPNTPAKPIKKMDGGNNSSNSKQGDQANTPSTKKRIGPTKRISKDKNSNVVSTYDNSLSGKKEADREAFLKRKQQEQLEQE